MLNWSDVENSVDPSLVWTALHSIGEGIILAGGSGRIIYSNPAADRLLGVPRSGGAPAEWTEHYGVYLPGTTDPFPTERYPLVRALAGEETDGVEVWIRNDAVPGGALLSATGRPVRDADGHIVGAAVVFRDVTDLRTAESALRDALSDLQEIQREKSELASFLVHDMKGPLTVILANAELISVEDRLAEEDRQGLEQITDSARTLHHMVLDLLDIQTADDGRLAPALETVPIRTVLERARAEAMTLGVPVTIEASGEPDALADPYLLRRVVGNLVDNCIAYGPEGGRIWLDARVEEDGRTSILVKDEGPGVPPGLRELIFQKYATLKRDVTRRRAGSRGLGLRFCKVAVEAHGGRISIDDNVPKGTAFRIELPGPSGTLPD